MIRTDSMRRAARKYYDENKDLVKAKSRKWRLEHPKEALAKATEWRRANPEKRQLVTLRHRLKKKYDISLERYFDLLDKQKGLCLICKNPERNTTSSDKIHTLLAVDHDHITGKVRGLLCKGCNLAIGSMEESPERFAAAIDYLKENK